MTASSANGQATRLSTWERRVQLPPAPLQRKTGCSGAAPRMRRKHETVGSIPIALTVYLFWGLGSVAERALDRRKTLVRLQPSLCMAADDQWQISGLWPREARASSEFDSLRSPQCLVVPLVKVSGCLPGETGPIPVRGAERRSGRRGQGARLKPGKCWFDSSGRHTFRN